MKLGKDIEKIAIDIVNYTNEINNVDLETRRKHNDKCVDYTILKIKEFNNPNKSYVLSPLARLLKDNPDMELRSVLKE